MRSAPNLHQRFWCYTGNFATYRRPTILFADYQPGSVFKKDPVDKKQA